MATRRRLADNTARTLSFFSDEEMGKHPHGQTFVAPCEFAESCPGPDYGRSAIKPNFAIGFAYGADCLFFKMSHFLWWSTCVLIERRVRVIVSSLLVMTLTRRDWKWIRARSKERRRARARKSRLRPLDIWWRFSFQCCSAMCFTCFFSAISYFLFIWIILA